jgi:dolichol kinase
MTLRARNDTHLARRLWHFGGVVTILALDAWLPARTARALSLSVTIFLVSIDVARLRWPRLNRVMLFLLGPFMRVSERDGPAGVSSLMAGTTLAIWIFPRSVTLLTLMLFAVADPVASYVGVRFGRDRIVGPKTLQGALAAFAAGVAIATAYYGFANVMRERVVIVAMLTGLITAASELTPIGRLDDNFVFPVMSASLLTGLFYVFGGF